MISQRHKNLKIELKHITTANRFTPFPVYDTEYVSHVEEQIKLIEDKYGRQ